MILGADTDEMRDVQQQCVETAKQVDQVVAFLTALVAILKAASLWTGGSSAAYAAYLEGTVIPWLKKISMALQLFAKVLGANAQAQDEVSSGGSVDVSTLPTYTSPAMPPTSCLDAPPAMTFPGGAGAAGSVPTGGAATAGSTATVDGSTATPVGTGSTYEGSGAGALGGTAGAGAVGGSPAAGTTGVGSGGSTYGSGSSAGSALGAGSSGSGSDTGSVSGAGAGSGTGSGAGSGSGSTSYDGGQVSAGGALGSGATPVDGDGSAGTGAGTYAAAGTAGALGLGGAAALAGRGTGQGYTSPTGFDYKRIKGVAESEHVTPEFLRKTEQIAARIGAKPEDLLAVMSFETGGSFDPAQKNMAGGSARGLIQFMPPTARTLHTTSEALSRMTAVQQLDYVDKYFGNGRYTTIEGLYSKVLAGRAVNDADGVLFREGTKEYRANRGVDLNRDGVVTAGEAAAKIRDRILPAR